MGTPDDTEQGKQTIDLSIQKPSLSNNNSDETETRLLDDLLSRSHLTPQPFTSSIPLVGRIIIWFRSAWNSVSTRWYLAPLLQQQSEFNQLVVEELHVLNNEFQIMSNKLQVLNGELQTLKGEFQTLKGEFQTLGNELRLSNHELHLLTTDQHELRQTVDEISDRLIANDRDVATLSYDLGKVTYTVIQLHEGFTGLNDSIKG
jgi:hypothetical protein